MPPAAGDADVQHGIGTRAGERGGGGRGRLDRADPAGQRRRVGRPTHASSCGVAAITRTSTARACHPSPREPCRLRAVRPSGRARRRSRRRSGGLADRRPGGRGRRRADAGAARDEVERLIAARGGRDPRARRRRRPVGRAAAAPRGGGVARLPAGGRRRRRAVAPVRTVTIPLLEVAARANLDWRPMDGIEGLGRPLHRSAVRPGRSRSRRDAPILYDSKDLVTHAVCVGHDRLRQDRALRRADRGGRARRRCRR